MKRAFLIVVLASFLQGCLSAPSTTSTDKFTLADFKRAKELPYDTPPQVIYRIDDHRYLTLEQYRDCHYGETYYNDTKQGIRKKMGRATIENFQGRLINADPTGMNVVIPSSGVPNQVCNDRGCGIVLFYSTDGGKTFGAVYYMRNSPNPFMDSKNYAIFVTKDRLYVAKRWGVDDAYVREYPLLPGIVLGQPYPPGITGSSFASSERPGIFSQLRTPTGQDRITCDPLIKPTNPDAPLVP